MTCIVGYKRTDKIILGGDSAGIGYGGAKTLRKEPKVFKIEEPAKFSVGFGFTSSFRAGQIVEWEVTPKIHSSMNDICYEPKKMEKYFHSDFLALIRSSLQSNGWNKKDNGEDRGPLLLIGVMTTGLQKLYRMDCDFQIFEAYNNYDAIGSGAPYALGALDVLIDFEENYLLDFSVNVALSTAAKHNSNVSAPFNLIELTI